MRFGGVTDPDGRGTCRMDRRGRNGGLQEAGM